ncbi:MAG: hypothetical protein K0S33_2125 [Bacteroidetes bacterium]|jgi:hypothetical protein|nr:hypothetical protein [Bacteroidota bacterium]
MSKAKTDSLFNLINSLTKSEKWQFKVYANRLNRSGNKIFVDVFDTIDRQKEYNEKAITTIKGLKAAQLPNIKQNLYKQVLASLSNSSVMSQENAVTRYVEHAKFLYNKCLYTDCLIIIEKAKKAAWENFQLIMLLELLELEKSAILQTSNDDISNRIEALVFEIAEVARQIQNIHRFSNLSVRLTAFYQHVGFIRNSSDLKSVREYYSANFPNFTIRQLSPLELLYLYITISAYYFFVQDLKNGYKYAKKCLQVFDEHPALMKAKTELYIKALNNLLVAQNKLFLYSEFRETHHRLVSLKRQKQIILTENLQLNLFKAIYIHEINRHFMLGEFKSGTRIVNALEKELLNFIPKLNKNTVMTFYYKIACLYFGNYQFKTAIKWLNHIINEKASDLREDLQSFARILRLICYFELNDAEMINYNIRATYRFLQKKQSFIRYQQLIMNFLRTIKKTDTQTKTITRFRELKTNMQKLENNRFEKRAFIYFDIVSWLESKIENRSMQDIVKKKSARYIS